MTVRFELSKKTDDTQKKQILVRVSVSREFRVGGKTKMFISPKDWDEKNNNIRKTSRIENIYKQKQIEELRQQLFDLQIHISKTIIESKDLETLVTKEDRQNWIDFVIDTFYDPSVKLTREKNLTFDNFTKIYIEVRSKEENWEPAKRAQKNKKKLWNNPRLSSLLNKSCTDSCCFFLGAGCNDEC